MFKALLGETTPGVILRHLVTSHSMAEKCSISAKIFDTGLDRWDSLHGPREKV